MATHAVGSKGAARRSQRDEELEDEVDDQEGDPEAGWFGSAWMNKAVEWLQDNVDQGHFLMCFIVLIVLVYGAGRKFYNMAFTLVAVALAWYIQANQTDISTVPPFKWFVQGQSCQDDELEGDQEDDGGEGLEEENEDEEYMGYVRNFAKNADYGNGLDSESLWLDDGTGYCSNGAASDGGAAAGADGKLDKARLDLLLRYMHGVEGTQSSRQSKQANSAQRQKLQRKLLLRSAAGSQDTGANGSGSAEDAVAADVLQDSGRMEQLLRELGENDRSTKPSGPRMVVGQKKSKHRGHDSPPHRRFKMNPSTRGSAAAPPTSERPVSAEMASDDDDQADQQQAASASGVVPEGVSPALPETAPLAAPLEDGDQSTPLGFQVVESRKAKRKGKADNRTTSAITPEKGTTEPASAASSAKAELSAAEATDVVPDARQNVEAPSEPDVASDSCDALVPCDPPAQARDVDDADATYNDDDEAEDWEWQCPSGNPLKEYICQRPTRCCSCDQVMPQDARALWSDISEWVACEECIRIAFQQPVEVTPDAKDIDQQPEAGQDDTQALVDDGVENDRHVCDEDVDLDPARMSAGEIAEWFKQHGAEDALRQCMMQVTAQSRGNA